MKINTLSGSKPGRIYGLVKVDKNNYPLRPVISILDSGEYELAKFIDSLIKPLIPYKCMLRSTDDFLLKLNNSNISSKTNWLVLMWCLFSQKNLYLQLQLRYIKN